jgi:hypothetical protein
MSIDKSWQQLFLFEKEFAVPADVRPDEQWRHG